MKLNTHLDGRRLRYGTITFEKHKLGINILKFYEVSVINSLPSFVRIFMINHQLQHVSTRQS